MFFREAAAPACPGEGPLHRPAAVKDSEPCGVPRFSDGPDDVRRTRSVRALRGFGPGWSPPARGPRTFGAVTGGFAMASGAPSRS